MKWWERALAGKRRLALAMLVIAGAGGLLGHALDAALYSVAIISALAVASVAILGKLERLERQTREGFVQVEALFNVFLGAGVSKPLPALRQGAVFPDFAAVILRHLVEARPRTILELGSGVSTLIIGYAIRTLELDCQFISVEQDAAFCERYRRRLRAHGLEGYVQIVHAPIGQVLLKTGSQRWYDLSSVSLPEQLDLVVVDGPSHDVADLARYPAWPVLRPRLHAGSLLLTDDANLAEERESLRRWQTEDSTLSVELLDTAKGSAACRLSFAAQRVPGPSASER
jgi:predicted O-methyltransferase YrrM